MKKNNNEKVLRYSIRKLTVGVISIVVGSLFFLGVPQIQASELPQEITQEQKIMLKYEYVLENDLTNEEKDTLTKGLPKDYKDGDVYYMVYRPLINQKQVSLPQTGDFSVNTGYLLGIMGVSLLVAIVEGKKKKGKKLFAILLITSMGISVLYPVEGVYAASKFETFSQIVTTLNGGELPSPIEFEGYTYIGYIKKKDSFKEKAYDISKNEHDVSNVEKNVPTTENMINDDQKEVKEKKPSTSLTLEKEKNQNTVISYKEEIKTVEIPCEVQYVENDALQDDEQIVKQEGEKGLETTVYRIKILDGKEVDRVVSRINRKDAVSRIVEIGKKQKNQPSVTYQVINHQEPIHFKTEYINDDTILKGERKIIKEGIDGQLSITYRIRNENGTEVSREEIERHENHPINQVVAIGVLEEAVPVSYPTVEEKPTAVITQENKVINVDIPFEIEYENNPNLSDGTFGREIKAGVKGNEELTYQVTYVDGMEVKRELISTNRTEPINRILERGTGISDIIVEKRVEELHFETEIIEDDTLPQGTEMVEQEGSLGRDLITITTTTLNGKPNGEPVEERIREIEPVKRVIRRGVKVPDTPDITEKTTRTNVIKEFKTEYIDDDTMWADDPEVTIREGQNQTETIEITVTKRNGEILSNTEKVIATTDLINAQIKRGTKTFEIRQRKETEDISFKEQVEIDENRFIDEEIIKVPGVKGIQEHIVTEKVNRQGEVMETYVSDSVVVKEAIDQVIVRGTKERETAVPVLYIVNIDKDEKNHQATITYSLEDSSSIYTSAKAKLYDEENNLLQEFSLQKSGEAILPLQLTGLDYYKKYILKTEVSYQPNNFQNTLTKLQDETRAFELIFKKIELKDIDSVGLYRINGLEEKRILSLDRVEDLSNYLVKIKSDKYKEIILPVYSIIEDEKDGQSVYKVTVAFDELVQDEKGNYVDHYSFFLAKPSLMEGVYTSFKGLVDAIKENPTGRFILGADVTADEIDHFDLTPSYVRGDFSGTLLGEHQGRRYAIYNLRHPLFESLKNAKVEELDLKEVNINSKFEEVGALAKKAQNSVIKNIAISGNVSGAFNVAGLLARALQGTVIENTNFIGAVSSRKQGYGENIVGGIAGLVMGNGVEIKNSRANVNIYTKGNDANHRTGGLVGMLKDSAVLKDSYVEGRIFSEGKSGQTGGAVGSTWQNGRIQNVISAVDVTNGKLFFGDEGYKQANIKEAYVVSNESKGQNDPWPTEISKEDALEKVSKMNITSTTEDSGRFVEGNRYEVNYLIIRDSKAERKTAYENMEKLLPFYNKELIVYYGNKMNQGNKLYQTPIIDVVPMYDNTFITDVHKDRQKINKLMIHYADNKVVYLNLKYKEDFLNSQIAEYEIADTGLIYTPEQFLSSYTNIITSLKDELIGVPFDSYSVRSVVGLSADTSRDKLSYLHLQPSFEEIKENIDIYLRKVLTMDKSINTMGEVVENQIIQKIRYNKEAFLLGLSYLNRWYDINYDSINTKELTTYKMDFFGNSNASVLDTVIHIGKLGYNDLHAKSNVGTFSKTLNTSIGKKDLFEFLEAYRELFLPDKGNNKWLIENSKAYIKEMESGVEEVLKKQKEAYGKRDNKYSVGVYDKITSGDWQHKNMLLPLLTMSQEHLFVISTMNTISFGGYERYRDKNDVTFDLVTYVRGKVDEAAVWQRDHADFWYKMIGEAYKDRMYRSVPNFDGFYYKDKNGNYTWRNLDDASLSIQEFFSPISKYYDANGSGAYATGNLTHFVVDRMLDQYGMSVFTHEMVHNSDGNVYFEGHGRREGQGAELFALGLLQATNGIHSESIGINTFLTKEKDTLMRLHTATPVERFKTVEDLNEYIHGMFDVLYTLDYLEANATLKQSADVKKKWLRKIENYYVKDKDQKDTHAGNRIRRLTDDEVASLNTLDDLIEQDIINRRNYRDNETFIRNGYYTVSMFSPIYAALDNPNGSPGDIMFRRMAYELMAAKGYHEGFLPYVSSMLAQMALQGGSKTWSWWSNRYVGLITDKHVLDYVFKGEYDSWDAFKKAMFKEREDKLNLIKPVTIKYDLGRVNSTKEVTISSYKQMQDLMNQAIEYDIKNIDRATADANASWVNTLKKKIYNAYLMDTDDFKLSIFREN